MPRLSLSRRAALAGGLLAGPLARAFGDASRFVPAVIQHGGRWDVRQSALRRLAWELQRRTSVEVVLDARALTLDSPRLFEHPFLVLAGEGEFPPFRPAELEALRRHLTYGGFLFADASDASDGAGFDASVRREVARLLPQGKLQVLPSTHVVFKAFFLLDSAPGRVFQRPALEAAVVNRRALVMYSQNDVLGALQREASGGYELDVTPGGERQRELATRLAVNIAMYALCLDYKDDAVHLPAIMNRRR